jgi:prepilin-type N-terminal cleavage/methylation domain-containing protein
MDCLQKSPRRSRSGFTLMELMVATGLGVIVFAAVAVGSVFSARSFMAMGNYAELDGASRNALDVMSREIRQTKGLAAFATNQLTFKDYDGATNLTYSWNPTSGILTRQKGATTTVLLKQCNSLIFGVSQQNPTNDFNFYPAQSLKTVALIDVSWVCSRQIMQQKVNTESVQTAKIVIRNRN